MTVLLGGQGAAEKFMTNLEDGVPENGKPLVVGCVGLVQTLQAASMRMYKKGADRAVFPT